MLLSLLAFAHAADKPSIDHLYWEMGGASQQGRVVVIVKDDTDNEVNDVELETSDGTFYGVTERISHVSGSFSTREDSRKKSGKVKLQVVNANAKGSMMSCSGELDTTGSVAELECSTKYELELENLRVWAADEAGTEWDLSFDLRGDDVDDVGSTELSYTIVNDVIEADPGPIEVESSFDLSFSGDPSSMSDAFDITIYDEDGKQQDKASFDVVVSTGGGVVRLNVVKAVKSATGLGLKEA